MRILLILAVPVLLAQEFGDDLRSRYHRARHELFLADKAAYQAHEKWTAVMQELHAACGIGTGKTMRIDGSGEPVCVVNSGAK